AIVAMARKHKDLDFVIVSGDALASPAMNFELIVYMGDESVIFAATTGGGRKMAEDLGTPFLGSTIPLDPRIENNLFYGKIFAHHNGLINEKYINLVAALYDLTLFRKLLTRFPNNSMLSTAQ
ncbi:11718_t:CDS:2, partial [Paraglomus brasilianum]